MALLLETDTYTNKDISAAVSIGSFTATATRMVFVRVLVGQVAGSGDYIVYATLQLAGSGSAYRIIPITTATAAASLTAIGFVSVGIPMDNTDVLTIYIDGLAGDTTTPDTRVDYYEMDYLRPTVAGRTLDVAETGEAGIDLTNKLDTTGILPAAAAGAANGLTIMPASGYPGADVKTWLTVAPLALSSQQVQAIVPDGQKVDVNTIKTKSVIVDAAGTTFPAVVGTSTYAAGAVASVTGDVGGKVIGGGSSTITGVGVWSDLRGILGTLLMETTPGWIAAAVKKLFNVATPALVASEAMRGTDSAALATTALSNVVWTDAKAGYLIGPAALEATLTAIKGAGWSSETLKAIKTVLDAIAVYGGGSGTGTYTDTITDGTNPLDGVRVQLSTDAGGSNRVYEAFTNASGVFTMNPDPGTYYRWLDLAGYTFTQGVQAVVS